MVRKSVLSLTILGLLFLGASTLNSSYADTPKADWTLLVFLNGDNNLDSFGPVNLEQMEKIGSTAQVNVVVQWASLANKKAQRLLVQKSTDPSSVTSPILQDLGQVDMGDYRNLTDFITWGAAKFPAKHYFVDVWNHGSGWHMSEMSALSPELAHQFGIVHPMDISFDDTSGNAITTKQLGQALADASKAIGQKIDLYASDACMMAMAEVANELVGTVNVFGGSQETEPGAGWPYDTFLARFTAAPESSALDISKMLTEEYTKSYQGGTNGTQEVTYSTIDLSKQAAFNAAVAKLAANLEKLDPTATSLVLKAAQATQVFAYSDYADLGDFIGNLQAAKIVGADETVFSDVKSALADYVVLSKNTSGYAKAQGISIWLPASQSAYSAYADHYKDMSFDTATGWGAALAHIVGSAK
jgi:hypothetical protein